MFPPSCQVEPVPPPSRRCVDNKPRPCQSLASALLSPGSCRPFSTRSADGRAPGVERGRGGGRRAAWRGFPGLARGSEREGTGEYATITSRAPQPSPQHEAGRSKKITHEKDKERTVPASQLNYFRPLCVHLQRTLQNVPTPKGPCPKEFAI